MKKPIKILVIVLGGVLLLTLILAVSLPLIVDPNQYKGKITELVKEKTGRDLRIEGTLGWSFFPWIGIETGRLELSNAPGFGADPFARIDGAGAKVELLPLLRKQVIVDTVFLNGLELNLARNAAGKTNWEDLTTPAQTEKPTTITEPGQTPEIGGFGVNRVDIRQANVTWIDQQSGERYVVKNLDLKTGKILGNRPVDVKLSFDLESGTPPLSTRVDLKSSVSMDVGDQKMEVTGLNLSLGDLNMQANFQGSRIFDAPAFEGSMTISPFDLSALLGKLGINIETTDKNVLDKLSLETKFSATTDSVELKDMVVGLDDSRLSGQLAVRRFTKPVYEFDLTLDQFDLDRYLPPPVPATEQDGAAAPAAPVEVPLSALRALTVRGKFRVKKLKAMNLHSSDAVVLITADNGLISLGPNQAKLYGGTYAGKTTLDVRAQTPVLAIDESVKGVELATILKDAMQFEKFAGAANLSAKVTAHGLDAEQIKKTLYGTAAFSVQNGSVKGIDLKKMSDTITTAKREKTYQKLSELKPTPGDETRFSQLGGTVQIKKGVVQNDDLKVQSPDLVRIAGQGTVDLPQETLNYRVTVGTFPIIIEGPFAKLTFKPDWNIIVKEKLEERKTEVKEKLEEKKTEAKEKLQEKLQDKLRDRFKFP